jgi:hypothetical protein
VKCDGLTIHIRHVWTSLSAENFVYTLLSPYDATTYLAVK